MIRRSFKTYHQDQVMLLPPMLNELIADDRPVRVINEVLNKIDTEPLVRQYKPGGTTSYHPLVLLKVLVYGYVSNIYSIHQNTNDTNTLMEHLEQFDQQHSQTPDSVTTDAGYGSEENYEYLEQNDIDAYVKYTQFDREQNQIIQSRQPFSTDKLYCNKEQDHYVCAIGQHMRKISSHTRTSAAGFVTQITRYQAANCDSCPLRGACHKNKDNRIIEVNHDLNRHKAISKQKLESEKGIYHRKKRCADVESVFGNVKNDHNFKRFLLRGIEKVSMETGLLAMAYNLRKKTA